MISKVIGKDKYAVFIYRGGIEKLYQTYEYTWGAWIPYAKVEIDARDDFELYAEAFNRENSELSEINIFIPIQ